MSAANDSQPILPWKDVRDSQTFQEADWTKRQKIRGNYARKVIDPRISDSKENRKARDAFFNATEEDVFGKRDEDSGRTSLGDSESLNYGYPGGLSDKQALADRRDASQDLDVPEPEGDDSGSTAVGLMRSGAAGLPASFGATAGGAGRIIQQSDINLANRRVDSAERSLRNIKETMGRALEGAPEGDRDSIRERYAPR